jgi:beta-galactosidase
LKALARRNGRVVATVVLRTAGEPHAVRPKADRKSLAADPRSLVFVTAEIVDARGVAVPDADYLISFDVTRADHQGRTVPARKRSHRFEVRTRIRTQNQSCPGS